MVVAGSSRDYMALIISLVEAQACRFSTAMKGSLEKSGVPESLSRIYLFNTSPGRRHLSHMDRGRYSEGAREGDLKQDTIRFDCVFYNFIVIAPS